MSKTNLTTETITIEAADVSTMKKMTLPEYAEYIQTHLLFVDSPGVIRATQGEYPMACTNAQLKILIDYLQTKSSELEP